MNLAEAKSQCENWLAYLRSEKQRMLAIQQIAKDRRGGILSEAEAQHRLRFFDRGLVVYDGARLAEAVRILLDHIGQDGQEK